MNKETTDRIIVGIIGTTLIDILKETATSVLLEGSEAALSALRANGFEIYRLTTAARFSTLNTGL